MTEIKEALSKAQKLTTTKMHYWAVAQLFDSHCSRANKLGEHMKAVAVALGPKMNLETQKELLVEYIDALRPLYVTAKALEDFKKTFGAFPEWTQFTNFKSQEALAAFIGTMIENFEFQSREHGTHNGKSIVDICFGGFIEKSEKIKIRGEQ